MKLISKIKEDWRKYSEQNSERKATTSEHLHGLYAMIVLMFSIWGILELVGYIDKKFFKKEPIKPYNIEVIYTNRDKDTLKNIKSEIYFNTINRLKSDDFDLGDVRSFKKIK